MSEKTKSQAEKNYHEHIASLPCVLCTALETQQRTATAVHHIREGQGWSQRASHWLVCALCHDCHQGPNGIHGDRTLLNILKLKELDLLAFTIEAANK